jgi:hypothetical protein
MVSIAAIVVIARKKSANAVAPNTARTHEVTTHRRRVIAARRFFGHAGPKKYSRYSPIPAIQFIQIVARGIMCARRRGEE